MESTRTSSTLIIGVALLIVFTSSNFFLFTWENTVGYFLVIVLASFLGGAVIVSFDRSLKIVSGTFVISCFVFLMLFLMPIFVLGEAFPGEMNTLLGLAAPQLARYVIVSFPASIFACLAGSFSGSSLV